MHSAQEYGITGAGAKSPPMIGGKRLQPLHKCGLYECGKHYHVECLTALDPTRKNISTEQLEVMSTVCPLHVCTKCGGAWGLGHLLVYE